MNWTGGRLRRQSHNRPGTLSRIEKQYFARARLKLREASNRAAASHFAPSFEQSHQRLEEPDRNSFRPRTSPVNKEGEGEPGICQTRRHHSQGLGLSQRRLSTSGELGSPLIPHESYGGSSYSKPPQPERQATQSHPRTSRLDNIKVHLLRQDDWAGISATRPLQMKFASIEEKENIGKRRRITRRDGEKTTVGVRRPFASELSPIPSKRRHAAKVFHGDATDNISIRIDGYQTNRPLEGGSQRLMSKHTSSETMLLDGDETGFRKLIRPPSEFPADEDTTLIQQGRRDLSSAGAITIASNHSCQRVVTPQVSPNPLIDNTDIGQRTLNESATVIQPRSNGSFSPTSHSSALPVLRRFTIDDQVLAEHQNELAKSMSSTARQSRYDPHMHHPTSQPSQGSPFRQRDYSGFDLINSSDGIISSGDNQAGHAARSFASNQTRLGWLRSEQEGEAINFFATPNRKTAWIQDTLLARAEWDIHARSASKKRSPSPVFFGHTIPQTQQIPVDNAQTPSPHSVRLIGKMSQSVADRRSQREPLEINMGARQFTHDISVLESAGQSPRFADGNTYGDDRKFTANIHCNPNPTRRLSHFNTNRETISPLIREHPPEGGIKGAQQEYQTEQLAEFSPCQQRSASASSHFRFPPYWTPQQGRRHAPELSATGPAVAVSSSFSPENRMQTSPTLALPPALHPSSPSFLSPSPLSFNFSFSSGNRNRNRMSMHPEEDRGNLPGRERKSERERERESQVDTKIRDTDPHELEMMNKNANTNATLPFFNTPFRR